MKTMLDATKAGAETGTDLVLDTLLDLPETQPASLSVNRLAPAARLPGANSVAFAGLRVAIVHDWLQSFSGSERVLEQMLLCFPDADLFTTVDVMPEADRAFLTGREVRTSFIQRLPFARRWFRHYLGLMPLAVQQFDLRGYDLVLSSSHAVAKGVVTGPDQVHIGYIHSPMRYIWDLQNQYLSQARITGGLRGAYARWLFARLRVWDVVSSNGMDAIVANSHYIARRIRKAYRRDAFVIHPPVDLDRFTLSAAHDDYYLLVSRFVPYKRADLVVESFARCPQRRLVVVGEGPEERRVRHAAGGAGNIEFRGSVCQDTLVQLMRHARALVFAAEEDFGITLVEAQACGTPVIAYGAGGAVDIVRTPERGEPTGILFPRQDADSLIRALDQFELDEGMFLPGACRANAERFGSDRFREALMELTLRVLEDAKDQTTRVA